MANRFLADGPPSQASTLLHPLNCWTEWAKRYPGARLTVFDTPETLAVTRKILEEKGASRLVALREGDFMRERLGGPFDFIWISQILHAYSEKECRFLLRKARRATRPGGGVAAP